MGVNWYPDVNWSTTTREGKNSESRHSKPTPEPQGRHPSYTGPRKGHRTVFLSFVLSRYHKIVSHYHKLEDRSHKLTSHYHKIVNRSQKLESRYHKILTRSHKLESRYHKILTHSHKLAKSLPQDTNSFLQVSKVVTTRY